MDYRYEEGKIVACEISYMLILLTILHDKLLCIYIQNINEQVVLVANANNHCRIAYKMGDSRYLSLVHRFYMTSYKYPPFTYHFANFRQPCCILFTFSFPVPFTVGLVLAQHRAVL